MLNQGALMRANYLPIPLLQPDTDGYAAAPKFLAPVEEIMVVEVDSWHFVNDKDTLLKPSLQDSCGTGISIVCSHILR
jgi:hypothetical protein